MGPVLVTADEIDDPYALHLETRVNGKVVQSATTGDMIFRIDRVISYASGAMTLRPGDVLATGTPEGVGFTRQPPIFLGSGDVVEIEIEHIGVLRNTIA
jgi:2-keto-4-pentenoate hydratase/2-oxohepta-3-ene-1,7-dioic acid hydratase in catechol pathway